jgi:hypothetical protein
MIIGVIFGSSAATLAVVLLLAGWLVSSRPDLARIRVEGGQVVIRPAGMVRVLAFRRVVRLDQSAIRQATAISRNELPAPRLRLLGTGMPGLQAGMFTTTGDKGICFLLVGRAQRFLRIDTDRGNVRLAVIQVRDPDLLAATLLAGGG